MRWMAEERFKHLLNKALAERITLTAVPRIANAMYASSGSDPKKRYVVSDRGCNCPAGVLDVDCKHYALFQLEHMVRLIETYGPPPWIREEATIEETQEAEETESELRAG